MSWSFYGGAIAFFTIVFGVFYAVAYSVLLGIHENYLRYCQKADLQWTGSASRFPKKRIRWGRVLPAAFLTAWMVVHFVILPG